ncbi:hypothetical protein RYX36_035987, partial [Vicia faba]
MDCWCQEECVMRTVTNLNIVNVGKKFWGCRNCINQLEKGCNFFKWVGDEVVDERDLKIERQRKKIFKLKNEVLSIRGMLKNTIMFGIVSL